MRPPSSPPSRSGANPGTGALLRGDDPRLAFLARDLQPIHIRRLVAHAAISQTARRLADVLDDLGGTVHLTDATAELALLAVFFAADMLAEVVVGAGVVLAAEQGNLSAERRVDLLPGGDRTAFGPNFPQFLHRDFLDRV